MNKRHIFLLILALTFQARNVCAGASDALDYLYDNRMYLADLAKNPISFNLGFKTVQIFPYPRQILAKYIGKNKTIWEKDRDTILDAFINLCRGGKKDTTVSFPRDTILIHGIVKILDCGSLRSERNAFSVLTSSVPYHQLERYGPEIFARLGASTIQPDNKKTLAALCNPPDHARNEMLSDSTIKRSLRARLGDKRAEDSIVLSFKNVQGFENASRLIDDLFICGSKKCLSQALSGFNMPIYSYGRTGYINSSIRVLIIEGLQRYYPYEPLLTDRYRYFREKSSKRKANEPLYVPDPEVKKYLEDFVAWGKREFGVIPEGEIGDPILFKGPCDSQYINK